jgi:phage baseplate assembly protein W
MSQIEKDLDVDTYIGIGFPLNHGMKGFFNRTQTALKQTKSNIKNLLLTKKGERLGNPLFGSDLFAVLFDLEGDVNSRVEEAVRSSIKQWLPFVEVNSVQPKFSDAGDSVVNIKIIFGINTDPATLEQLNIDLENYQDDIDGEMQSATY